MGPKSSSVRPSRNALPPAAGGSISGTRVYLAMLLIVIAVAAIVGVVVAASSGQPTVAIAIALISGAFFCRVGA